MNLKVSVLGAGSFGTTMAHVISRNAPTLLWCRRADMAEEINREHRNSTYLPDAPLAESLRATGDLEEAIRAARDFLESGTDRSPLSTRPVGSSLGRALEKAGRPQEAAEAWRAMNEVVPGAFETRDAITLIDRLIEAHPSELFQNRTRFHDGSGPVAL